MASPKSVGQITDSLLLIHLVAGLMLPYILMQPAMASPGFLENAAANVVRIRTAVLLLFMSGAITVAVALTALPVFRRYGDRLAALLVVLSAVNLGMEIVTPMAMPLAPAYVAVAAWLMFKGFEDRQGPTPEGPAASPGGLTTR